MTYSQFYKVFLICLYFMLAIKFNGHAAGNLVNVQNDTLQVIKDSTVSLHAFSSNAVAYQWYRDNEKIDGAIFKDYLVKVSGTFSVIAYNTEGCAAETSNPIYINFKRSPVVFPKSDSLVDLAISIRPEEKKPIPGSPFNYIVAVSNNSDIAGSNVKVTFQLPVFLSYTAKTGNDLPLFDPLNRTLTWNIGDFQKHSSKMLDVKTLVLRSGAAVTKAEISGTENDPVKSNNIAQNIQQINPLSVPNVFTPNGDGINDTFTIPGLDAYSESELIVMNSTGSSVYNKKNYMNDWTGDGLPEGTYFYILKVKSTEGVWDAYKGYVTLLRTKLN